MGFLEDINQIKDAKTLQNILGARFAKNRAFFQKIAPELAEFLTKPPTRFGLIADEQGVNLVNLHTGNLVYGFEGNRHQMIEHSLVLAKDPFNHTKWSASAEGMDLYEIGEKFRTTNAAALRIRQAFEQDSKFMPDLGDCHLPSNFLPPIFCYGLAGGLFLENLRERYNFIQSVFIYEPESDFFTASCHFVDYEALQNSISSKLLGIFIKDEPPQAKIREFFARQRITASFAKLELTLYDSPHMEAIKTKIALEHSSNTRGWGTFEDEMIGVANHIKNFNTPKLPVLVSQKYIDAPICVVGNGASLDQDLEFLSANSDKMIIFACGTALRTLRKHSIKPDFQVEIERLDYLPGVLAEAGLDDIPLIASNVVHPLTFALAKEKYAFFRDFTASSYFKTPKQMLHFSSPYVGNAAFALALNFSKKIILCGIDVGYKKNSGMHSKDSIYKDEESLPLDSVIAEPNFQGSEIYSNPLYNLSNMTITWAIDAKNGVQVYNMSDGAKIRDTISTKLPPLQTINKDAAIRKIKSCFSVQNTFKNLNLPSVEEQMKEFCQEMTTALQVKVIDKKDLFCALDIFMIILESQYLLRPAATLLLGGSLKHLAFLLFMSILHIKGDKIEENYLHGASQIIKFMQETIIEYEFKKSSNKISSILNKVIKK
jgi:hypothetical protein